MAIACNSCGSKRGSNREGRCKSCGAVLPYSFPARSDAGKYRQPFLDRALELTRNVAGVVLALSIAAAIAVEVVYGGVSNAREVARPLAVIMGFSGVIMVASQFARIWLWPPLDD